MLVYAIKALMKEVLLQCIVNWYAQRITYLTAWGTDMCKSRGEPRGPQQTWLLVTSWSDGTQEDEYMWKTAVFILVADRLLCFLPPWGNYYLPDLIMYTFGKRWHIYASEKDHERWSLLGPRSLYAKRSLHSRRLGQPSWEWKGWKGTSVLWVPMKRRGSLA